ncbi:MAG: hypothetical protein A3F09_01220 [Chlamydiae bacterium RIFCSPHIGHO2_12_FULL_49_11]|nr:MAG: hypothetical protein A3F09_01220 [Chlamydiae bacterium RIFCSPHIGHO2_12_FULL_49_11]
MGEWEILFEELVLNQKKKMLDLAGKLVGQITEEDLLQPFDYPELETSPHFRYEEGILEGILTVRAALFARKDA